MVAYLDALDALAAPVPAGTAASWPPSGPACSSWPRLGPPAPTPTSSRSSTRRAPGASSAPGPCWRLRWPSSWRRTRSGPGNWPAATPAPTSACPTTPQNLRTFGFGDEDIEGGGSDRLIDAVIPWGDAATWRPPSRAHHEAGADHVCLQVVADRQAFPLDEYRGLAPALSGL